MTNCTLFNGVKHLQQYTHTAKLYTETKKMQ